MAIVSCNLPSNLSSNDFYSFSDYCSDFSSLDSSVPWTFSAILSTNSQLSSREAITFYLLSEISSPLYLTNFPNFLFFQVPYGSPSGVSYSYYVTTDSHPSHFKFYFSNYTDFSSFTISDEGLPSSGDCPVCEECQECPVVPENPYDEKLDNITQAIYVCAAVVLVVYFFYCIYRMLIKNSGVK